MLEAMERELTLKQLNRATLDRQLLLRRGRHSVPKALQRIVGIQAEDPVSPYIGLHARIASFRPSKLDRALESREVVRALLMRGTIHAVTSEDYLSWAETLRDVSVRSASRYFQTDSAKSNLQPALRKAAELAAEASVDRAQLCQVLAPFEPKVEPRFLAFAARAYLPLVQIPPRGKFRNYGPARYVISEQWIGGTMREPDAENLARRYLSAFGPTTSGDFAAWSGLTGAKRLFESMVDLRRYRGPAGEVMFDVPGRRIPAPDTQVGPRFLPSLDNALLGYADRTRIVPAGQEELARPAPDRFRGPILIYGFVAGRWSLKRGKKKVAMRIELAAKKSDTVLQEGLALLKFLEPDAAACAVTYRRL